MSRLLLLLLLVCAVSAGRSCIIREKKDEPEIRVIHIGEQSKESGDSEIVLHIPDDKRKREVRDEEPDIIKILYDKKSDQIRSPPETIKLK